MIAVYHLATGELVGITSDADRLRLRVDGYGCADVTIPDGAWIWDAATLTIAPTPTSNSDLVATAIETITRHLAALTVEQLVDTLTAGVVATKVPADWLDAAMALAKGWQLDATPPTREDTR
jgi:hypothetical protein